MSEIKTSEIVGALLKQGSWYLTHAGWHRTENPSMVSLKAIETISALQSELTTAREAAWRAGAEAMREAVENYMTTRVRAERIVRGAAWRDKDQERVILHTDRALAFYEMALAVVAFPIPPCPPREGDVG